MVFGQKRKRNPTSAKNWHHFILVCIVKNKVTLSVFFRSFHFVSFSGSWHGASTGKMGNRFSKGFGTFDVVHCENELHLLKM